MNNKELEETIQGIDNCKVCGQSVLQKGGLCRECLEAKRESDRVNRERARQKAFPIHW